MGDESCTLFEGEVRAVAVSVIQGEKDHIPFFKALQPLRERLFAETIPPYHLDTLCQGSQLFLGLSFYRLTRGGGSHNEDEPSSFRQKIEGQFRGPQRIGVFHHTRDVSGKSIEHGWLVSVDTAEDHGNSRKNGSAVLTKKIEGIVV